MRRGMQRIWPSIGVMICVSVVVVCMGVMVIIRMMVVVGMTVVVGMMVLSRVSRCAIHNDIDFCTGDTAAVHTADPELSSDV